MRDVTGDGDVESNPGPHPPLRAGEEEELHCPIPAREALPLAPNALGGDAPRCCVFLGTTANARHDGLAPADMQVARATNSLKAPQAATPAVEHDIARSATASVSARGPVHVPDGKIGQPNEFGDYALRTDWVALALRTLDLGTPQVDAFSTAASARFPYYWSASQDAFRQPWEKFQPLWINPPFALLAQVIARVVNMRLRAYVVVPDWDCLWRLDIVRAPHGALLLPRQTLFCLDGVHPLPTPAWRVYVVGFWGSSNYAMVPAPSLMLSGDVEPNPGPATPPMPFTEFATSFASDFMSHADKTQLARHYADLQRRSIAWQPGWHVPLLEGTSLSLDLGASMQLLAAYEVYSDTRLTNQGATFGWVTEAADEVAALKAQLAALKLQLEPPSQESLRGDYYWANVTAFKNLNPGPQWMKDLVAIFEDVSKDISDDKTPHLLDIWRLLVDAHFRYSQSFPRTPGVPSSARTPVASSSNATANGSQHVAASRRPVPITLRQVTERGGTVAQETTAHGATTFAYLDGHKYYVSKKGDLWDTTVPPPQACFRCGQAHWHWECSQ